jgi:hypothetical protein
MRSPRIRRSPGTVRGNRIRPEATIAPGAAADNRQGSGKRRDFLQDSERIANGKGGPFVHGTGEVPRGRSKRCPDKTCAKPAVPVRTSFAGQIGMEHETFRTWRDVSRFLVPFLERRASAPRKSADRPRDGRRARARPGLGIPERCDRVRIRNQSRMRLHAVMHEMDASRAG